jgi:hypothetical protein
MNLKHFKINKHGLCAIFIILFAIVLRIILIIQGWPETNSDEGTLGLMALHIAYRSELPIFFYGQGYMGPFEAYLAAILFHLFGPSLFVLRLGLVLVFTLFLVSIYLLTRLLFSKNMALITLFLLSLGSDGMLAIQLRAIGGYPETLLFGTLELLIATWLALSFSRALSPHKYWIRFVMYGCWGFLVGFSIWTDLLVLPFVLTSGLLLFVFCWREWRSWAPICIMTSFLIGVLPLIIYNFTVPNQDSSLSFFLRIYRSDATGNYVHHIQVVQKIVGTLLYGIPTATGANPICPDHNLPLLSLFNHSNSNCTLYPEGWSLCYLLLLIIAVFLNSKSLWKQRHERQSAIHYFARLMLLGSACLTILLFANSPVSALDPWTNSRYLFCLLVATPAIIAPLWEQVSTVDISSSWKVKLLAFINGTILIYIAIIWLMGYVNTVQAIPSTQALNRQQEALITDLLRLHATHIYSEYWTCDSIIFQSNERIICAVVTNHIKPGFNRYQPYYAIVTKDPHASFVFPLGSSPAFHFPRIIAFYHQHFRRYIFDGYVVYQPMRNSNFQIDTT